VRAAPYRVVTASLLIGIGACGSAAVMVPCPQAPGQLVPSSDTVGVGATALFHVSASDLALRNARQIRWSVDDPRVASVDSLTGVATATSVGVTTVRATDRLAPVSCPDSWVATIVVR